MERTCNATCISSPHLTVRSFYLYANSTFLVCKNTNYITQITSLSVIFLLARNSCRNPVARERVAWTCDGLLSLARNMSAVFTQLASGKIRYLSMWLWIRLLACELVMLTTRSSTIFKLNRSTAAKFDSTTILRSPATNVVVPECRTRTWSRIRCRV